MKIMSGEPSIEYNAYTKLSPAYSSAKHRIKVQ